MIIIFRQFGDNLSTGEEKNDITVTHAWGNLYSHLPFSPGGQLNKTIITASKQILAANLPNLLLTFFPANPKSKIGHIVNEAFGGCSLEALAVDVWTMEESGPFIRNELS